jgi:hypothetical protein
VEWYSWRSMRELSTGNCEHCSRTFGYYLIHSGFNESRYAYCENCGRTAILSAWNKLVPILPPCPPHCEICKEWEPYIKPCECGRAFKKGAAPRCPHCSQPLSAEKATTYIETNAPGTKKGWRWQRNWQGLYCIVIENREIHDNFKV